MCSGPMIDEQEEGALASWKGDGDVGQLQLNDANMEEVSFNEDTSFTVKIQAPGIEPINFQVLNPLIVPMCDL